MGRVERRKEERKNKKKKNIQIEEVSGKETLYTAIKIVLVMALILFVLYYIVAVFITKEVSIGRNKEEEETTENNPASSVTDKILANTIFNQKEESYYVYFYDFNDENESIANAITNLTDKVYKVDTSSSLNKNYVTEEETGNKEATNLDNLKVINPTLIKITNDQITEYYEEENSILEYLNK